MDITEKNFEEEVLKSSGTVIVDFYGTWCMPCKMLAPIVEKVAEENNIKLCKVDIDENEELIKRYKIMAVPTLKFFKDGNEIDTLVGLTSESKILESIEKAK